MDHKAFEKLSLLEKVCYCFAMMELKAHNIEEAKDRDIDPEYEKVILNIDSAIVYMSYGTIEIQEVIPRLTLGEYFKKDYRARRLAEEAYEYHARSNRHPPRQVPGYRVFSVKQINGHSRINPPDWEDVEHGSFQNLFDAVACAASVLIKDRRDRITESLAESQAAEAEEDAERYLNDIKDD